ncbi:tautomerase family protein [Bradyrhizobium sp. UFLA05-112]
MPHVIVKMQPGRSEKLKSALAEAVTRAVVDTLKIGDESVSVGIEDVQSQDWTRQVYEPDILAKPDTIYKKPGYDPR